MKKNLTQWNLTIAIVYSGTQITDGIKWSFTAHMVPPDLMDRDVFIKIKKNIIPNKVLVATFSFIPINSVPKE